MYLRLGGGHVGLGMEVLPYDSQRDSSVLLYTN